MLHQADIAAFQARLIALRAELESLLSADEDAAGTVELDQTRVGRLSRMDALQNQAMSQEQQRRRQLELTRIGAALARIETGEFGLCVGCSGEIAEKRLELDPAAPLCIECASRSER